MKTTKKASRKNTPPKPKKRVDNRQRGKRAEYLLRDFLNDKGMPAFRVPFSGASHGFKGDVQFSHGGRKYLMELKLRKDAFEEVYLFWETYSCDITCYLDSVQFIITDDPKNLFKEPESFESPETLTKVSTTIRKKALATILKAREWLKECDFLTIKQDRKPFLFIRYWKPAKGAYEQEGGSSE